MAEDSEDDPRLNESAEQQIDSTIIKLAEQYASLEQRAKALNEEKKNIREQADKIGITSLAWQIGVKTVKLMDKGERMDFMRGFRRVTGVLGDRQRELFPEDAERIARRKAAAEEKAAKQPRSPQQLDAQTNKNPRSNPDSGGAGKKRGRPPKATGPKASPAAIAAEMKAQNTGNVVPLKGATAAAPVPPKAPADPEQAEGDAVLKSMVPETEAAKSAAEVTREAAAQSDAFLAEQVAKRAPLSVPGLSDSGQRTDEKPLSQSAQAQQKLEAAKLA